MDFVALRIFYILNIIVAGMIGVSAMSNTTNAAASIFENAYPPTEIMKLVGCLWFAIAILSALGLWKPITFSPVLLIQFIYKGSWLLLVAIPAVQNNLVYPKSMAIFFVVWVMVLPFIIPWTKWLNALN